MIIYKKEREQKRKSYQNPQTKKRKPKNLSFGVFLVLPHSPGEGGEPKKPAIIKKNPKNQKTKENQKTEVSRLFWSSPPSPAEWWRAQKPRNFGFLVFPVFFCFWFFLGGSCGFF